jgi:autotransporter-associated beta strand protein
LIKDEAGTLILSAANTYTGSTRVDGGTLRIQGTMRTTSGILVNSGAIMETAATNVFSLDHSTAVAASRVVTVDGGTWNMVSGDSRIGNVTLNNGATWTSNVNTDWGVLLANNSVGASTVSVGGTSASTMNGSGSIRLQGIQNFDVSDVTGSSATDLVVSMQLRANGNAGGAAGGINKLGAGTMDLQGTNDYAGTTTVTAGTLLVNGAITGTGAINVLNTSTLGGNGEIAGAVSIASTAFLAPGNSIGTDLGLASLDLDGTLEIEWDSTVSPEIDFFNVIGALALDAGSTVSFTNLGAGSLTAGPTNGFVFAQYGSLTGTFGNVVGLPSGFSIDYNYGGLNQIAIIPEPSVSLLGALGALGLVLRRRRQADGAVK